MTTIVLENVTLRRGSTPVLAGVSLEVRAGEVLALVGPSGSGKTSLLRSILGFVAPDEGRVTIDGRIVSEAGRLVVPPEERGLGVVFQDLALWPHLTVDGNLRFVLDARGVARSEQDVRIRSILARVGLVEKASRRPGELSGGERQRVAIARALVAEPRAVLLDEPLASLDVVLKRELIALFRELLAERKTTALYVTHDPREAAALGDRIGVLVQGRLVRLGTLDELRSGEQEHFVKVLLEDIDRGAASR